MILYYDISRRVKIRGQNNGLSEIHLSRNGENNAYQKGNFIWFFIHFGGLFSYSLTFLQIWGIYLSYILHFCYMFLKPTLIGHFSVEILVWSELIREPRMPLFSPLLFGSKK